MGPPGTAPQTFDARNNSLGPDVPLYAITHGTEKFMFDQSQELSKEDGNVRLNSAHAREVATIVDSDKTHMTKLCMKDEENFEK